MADRDQILRLIFEVVDDINATLPEDERIHPTDQTPIFGFDAGFDSLSRLDLILGVETQLAESAGVVPNLSEILIGDTTHTVPETLGALASLIAEIEADA